MAVTGSQIVSEIEQMGGSATGYSETLDSGTGPQYFDCSGLVQSALTKLGFKNVPRTTESQWAWLTNQGAANTGTPTASELQPGDLVYATFQGDNGTPGHVGVYIGNGQVYSAQDQALGIGISSLSSWSQSGQVNGWAVVPGASGATPTPTATADCSFTSPAGCLSNAATQAATGILDSFGLEPSKIKGLAERGSLIVAGALCMIIGAKMLGSGSSSGKSSSDKPSSQNSSGESSDTSETSSGTGESSSGLKRGRTTSNGNTLSSVEDAAPEVAELA